MKLGFTSGNRIGKDGAKITQSVDQFLNFTFVTGPRSTYTIQFFNQTQPRQAAAMLRQMATKIEQKAMEAWANNPENQAHYAEIAKEL